MKSNVAPKVVWRSRGEEGGDPRPSPAITTPDWPPSSAAPRTSDLQPLTLPKGMLIFWAC